MNGSRNKVGLYIWVGRLGVSPSDRVPFRCSLECWGEGGEELVRYLRTCGTRPLEKVKSGVIRGCASGVRQGDPRAILTRVLFTRSGWFGRNTGKPRSRQEGEQYLTIVPVLQVRKQSHGQVK